MYKRLLLGFWAICLSLQLMGQARIGFTNANGFPSVVAGGGSYTLDGWIVNRGTTAFTGNIDVKITFNGGNAFPVDNNFSVANPIQPGDSIYWSKNNFNFPNGQLAPGNNDILVWPTRSQGGGVLSDTVETEIFYTEDDAAFAISPEAFQPFAVAGMEVKTKYDLLVTAANCGQAVNSEDVSLYMQVDNFYPHKISSTAQSVEPGENVFFYLEDFYLSPYIQTHYPVYPLGFNVKVRFFVHEDHGLEAVNEQEVDAYVDHNLVLGQDETPFVYAAQGGAVWMLNTLYTPMLSAMDLYDVQGRWVRSVPLGTTQLDLDGLGKGVYFLRIQSVEGKSWTCKVPNL